MSEYMQTGRFKVFSTCVDFFGEFRQYHRDKKGFIVKVGDDVLSATRYAFMMRRFAEKLPSRNARIRRQKDWKTA